MCFTKVLNLRRNIGVWLTGVGYKNNSFSLTGLLLFNLIQNQKVPMYNTFRFKRYNNVLHNAKLDNI